MTSLSERLGNWFPVVVALALPLVFIPTFVDAFILPRTSIVVTGAFLGAGLALLIQRRASLGELRWPLAAAAAAAVIAFALSTSWPLSLIGSYTRYESLPVRLSYLGLLAVPVWLLRSELARSLAVAAVVLGATVTSAEAIAQWLLAAPFRPDGNLGNANLLGALVAMALPIALSNMFRPGWVAGGWWAAAGLMAGGLLASTSRGGMVGALAGCLALGVFALRGRKALAAGVVTALVSVAAVLAVLLSPLRELNGDPGPTRVHLYHDAVGMILARPLSGWGEDATGLVFGRFLTGDWSPGVTFDRVHSGVLDLAATQGLLGVVALGSVVAVLFAGFWRRRFAPPAAAPRVAGAVSVGSIAAACFGYTVWVLFNFDWAPATGVFWLLAGIGWSAVQARRADVMGLPAAGEAAPISTRTVPRVAGALALVAVAVVFAALPIVAEGWYANGRPELSTRADPLQAEYHRALGEALISQGKADEGRGELRLAANLGSTDPALYVELGDADLRAGDVALARADYRMALTIDPFWAPARQRLAGSSGGLGAA
jgi:O-antigen ligase